MIRSQRGGQIFETQIGPLAFENQEASRNWLVDVATKLAIGGEQLVIRLDGVNSLR